MRRWRRAISPRMASRSWGRAQGSRAATSRSISSTSSKHAARDHRGRAVRLHEETAPGQQVAAALRLRVPPPPRSRRRVQTLGRGRHRDQHVLGVAQVARGAVALERVLEAPQRVRGVRGGARVRGRRTDGRDRG